MSKKNSPRATIEDVVSLIKARLYRELKSKYTCEEVVSLYDKIDEVVRECEQRNKLKVYEIEYKCVDNAESKGV